MAVVELELCVRDRSVPSIIPVPLIRSGWRYEVGTTDSIGILDPGICCQQGGAVSVTTMAWRWVYTAGY